MSECVAICDPFLSLIHLISMSFIILCACVVLLHFKRFNSLFASVLKWRERTTDRLRVETSFAQCSVRCLFYVCTFVCVYFYCLITCSKIIITLSSGRNAFRIFVVEWRRKKQKPKTISSNKKTERYVKNWMMKKTAWRRTRAALYHLFTCLYGRVLEKKIVWLKKYGSV